MHDKIQSVYLFLDLRKIILFLIFISLIPTLPLENRGKVLTRVYATKHVKAVRGRSGKAVVKTCVKPARHNGLYQFYDSFGRGKLVVTSFALKNNDFFTCDISDFI